MEKRSLIPLVLIGSLAFPSLGNSEEPSSSAPSSPPSIEAAVAKTVKAAREALLGCGYRLRMQRTAPGEQNREITVRLKDPHCFERNSLIEDQKGTPDYYFTAMNTVIPPAKELFSNIDNALGGGQSFCYELATDQTGMVRSSGFVGQSCDEYIHKLLETTKDVAI